MTLDLGEHFRRSAFAVLLLVCTVPLALASAAVWAWVLGSWMLRDDGSPRPHPFYGNPVLVWVLSLPGLGGAHPGSERSEG